MPVKPNKVTWPVGTQSNGYSEKAITKVNLILVH